MFKYIFNTPICFNNVFLSIIEKISQITNQFLFSVEMIDIIVVEGGLATLPCSLKPSEPLDSVQLVLWIKEGVHTPIYRFVYVFIIVYH